MLDGKDRRLLAELQRDAGQSIEDLASKVSLSRNACWRRIKALEDEGIITKRVALVDPEKLNLGLAAFIAVKTAQHDPKWLEKFASVLTEFPEIVGAYRTTGDTDYLLQVVMPDMKGYDRLYKRIIAKIPLSDVSSSFVMEKIKATTALPLDQA